MIINGYEFRDQIDEQTDGDLVAFFDSHRGLDIVGVIPFDSSERTYVSAYAQKNPWERSKVRKPLFTDIELPDERTYISMVAHAKQLIADGFLYQINITDKVTAKTDATSHELLHWCAAQKGSFPALLTLPDVDLISASPEQFLTITGGIVEAKPMKGTRKLAASSELDSSEKEHAELDMITDLLRNDIASICTPGSVTVTSRRTKQMLDTLVQTSSVIRGQLNYTVHPFGEKSQLLPAGSITGVPKKEATKWIRSIEAKPRGYYTGIAFHITPNGNLWSQVLIRTMTKRGSSITLGVGSGIVWDSDPKDEYEEMINKAYIICQGPSL